MITDQIRKEIKFAFSTGASVHQVCKTYGVGKTLAYELKNQVEAEWQGIADKDLLSVFKASKGEQSSSTPDTTNDRILLISDDHEPYSHPDKFEFLQAIKDEYDPTRAIHLGDEVDQHYLNFHIKEHTILNPVGEKGKAIEGLRKLQDMFPVMDLLHSNHGDLAYRKAKIVGLLPDDLKSRKDRFLVDADWTWHQNLTLETKLGKVHFAHTISGNVLRASKDMGMSLIQGHYHTKYSLSYWSTPESLNFALQMPCLIDVHCDAYNYINPFKGRVLVGAAMLIDGLPHVIPLVKKKSGRWNNKINKVVI